MSVFTLLPLLSKVSETGGVDKDWIASYVLANACCGAKRHYILFHAIERTFFFSPFIASKFSWFVPNGKVLVEIHTRTRSRCTFRWHMSHAHVVWICVQTVFSVS